MAVPSVEVNFLAVLTAGIASMILGAFWYSPLLFGNLWMKFSRMKSSDLNKAKKKGIGKLYFISFITTLVTSLVLAHFVQYATAETFGDAAQLGFWLWLGFIAPVTLGVVLWEGKSFKLWVINNAYQFISLMIMAAILVTWR